MSRLLFLMICLCLLGSISLSAQEDLSAAEKQRRQDNIEAANPFKQFGYKAKIATLSKGKYLEVHDLDSIVTIGSIRFHVEKMKIVGIVIADSTDREFARPIGDMASRWLSPDPLTEEYPDWTPYRFGFNNPTRYNDPTGLLEEDWIPGIEVTKDSNGNVNGGHIVAKPEQGDTPETLATFLGVSMKEANQLYNNMQSSGSSSVVVPESIAGPMNAAVTDAIMNPSNYTDSMFIPDSFETNYNCFECASSIAQGNTPNLSNIEAPFTFSADLKRNYSHASPSEYKFGQTVIRFGENRTNILGMSSNISTHAATYLGTSQNGTIYTFSKNGMIAAPGVFKLSTLESMYGKNQGVGPTKNESGFYNPIK